VIDLAVSTALAIASSGASPHRSVRVNSASALTTTASARFSWRNASGRARPRLPSSGASASSMIPKRWPGRMPASPGRTTDAAIIARTAPW
jgi:hypothetical protein